MTEKLKGTFGVLRSAKAVPPDNVSPLVAELLLRPQQFKGFRFILNVPSKPLGKAPRRKERL